MNLKKENDNINNFNINKLTYETALSFHSLSITCIIQLNDGRLVSGSKDKRIIIYSKKCFTKSFEINEHTEEISSLLQLKNQFLASSSFDKYIKIFKINENNYETIQSIKAHTNYIHKIRELSNGNLISCSLDKTIKIFNLENGIFIEKFKFIEDKWVCNILETINLNLVAVLINIIGNINLNFYDLNKRKLKKILFSLEVAFVDTLEMISKNLLIIGEVEYLTIINVDNYQNIKNIKIGNILISICYKLNDNILLTGDVVGNIKQWKIEDNNLILENIKEKAHNKGITSIIKLQNNKLATSSIDKSIRIW